MKRIAGMLAAAVLLVAPIAAADAPDLGKATFLIASTDFDGSPFEQAVIIAAPATNGRHIGFIINRRTSLKLGALFPDDAAARNVTEPVYVGGTMFPQVVFALTRHLPEGTEAFIPLMSGVYAVLDAASVHHLVETRPNEARYFVGLMVWAPGELEEEIRIGLWDARPADVRRVTPAHAVGLSASLHGVTPSKDEAVSYRRPAPTCCSDAHA